MHELNDSAKIIKKKNEKTSRVKPRGEPHELWRLAPENSTVPSDLGTAG